MSWPSTHGTNDQRLAARPRCATCVPRPGSASADEAAVSQVHLAGDHVAARERHRHRRHVVGGEPRHAHAQRRVRGDHEVATLEFSAGVARHADADLAGRRPTA